MRCVILNTYDIQGGAARAAFRLHKGLIRLGQDSAMVTRFKRSEEPTVYEARLTASPAQAPYLEQLALIQRHLIDRNRTEISNTFFSLPWPGYDLALHPEVQKADVLNLHWVAGLLSPESIFRLRALGKPIVWTLHDQRAFTGGCHFSAGCRGYEDACLDCPQLRDNSLRLTEKLLGETLRILPARDLTVVTPSRWLAECARHSAVFRNTCAVTIPNSLEEDLFKPLEKAAARQKLGLNPEGFYFLFGADNRLEKRKGFDDLLAAISLCLQDAKFKQKADAGQVQFLCFGLVAEPHVSPGVKIKDLGQFASDAALCEVYAAADIFLLPSLEDNLPNTVIEAMACGTPVIAYETGGVPEIIAHDQTGYLVPVSQPAKLAQAMMFAVAHPERVRAWRDNGLRSIHDHFSLKVQARSYLSVFEDALARQRPATRTTSGNGSKLIPLLEESLPFNETEVIKPKIVKMETLWSSADGNDYKSSWRRGAKFLNAEHEQIWEKTKDLPGWQAPPDSQKLYEIGFYSGGIILEIGVYGGRSAVVELLGANAAAREWKAQYYGLDVDPSFLERSLPTLRKAGVAEQCLLYHGNLRQFHWNLPIVPSMVFVDGDHKYAGVKDDLLMLKEFVAPETPILCHDYADIDDIRRAVDEMLQTPYYQMVGLFAGSILLRATEKCPGRVTGLPPELFEQCRNRLLARYFAAEGKPACVGLHTPVASLVRPARDLLAPGTSDYTASGCGPWPYSTAACPDLPATMPNGQPWPRISIITPSFNQGQFIEQTLLSVLNQKYPNLEYIVIDGGSTDETGKILAKYGDRLAYCVSERDRGQCHAINKGFARVTGEICSWLNSDDLLAPGALAAVALAFRTSGADMVAGICQLIQDDHFSHQHLTSCPDGPLSLEHLLDQERNWDVGHFFYQPEVFFTREIWERAGGHLDESLYFSLDYELWLRFAAAGARLKVIGYPLAHYRVHAAQKTYAMEKFRPELRAVRERFLGAKTFRPSRGTALKVKTRLRVVLLTDIGFRYGAGIAHRRLGEALSRAGNEVFPLALCDGQATDAKEKKDEAAWLLWLLPRIRSHQPDVVMVGNVHGVQLPPACLHKIAAEWATVFVLHDAWLLTGRCAYTGDCLKYLSGCEQSCPTAEAYPPLPRSEIRAAWESKRQLIAQTNGLVLAADSRWLLDLAADVGKSLLAVGTPPQSSRRLIRYGLPLDVFKPRDRRLCRELLGLPQDKFLLLFSCTNMADPRKGTGHLLEALRQLDLTDLLPVCVGHGSDQLLNQLPDLVSLGYLSDPYRQALVYSAADLFVAPSLEEAFGQVFIEAAACGLPSVAYPVGGVPEALLDGISGRLAAAVSPEALAKTIFELYRQPKLRRDLGVWGSLYVQTHFSLESSYFTLSFALREALASRGIQLASNICFPAPAPVPCAPLINLAPPPSLPLEQQMEEYFQKQLEAYRLQPLAWFFKPQAWLARMSRNAVRKARRD